MNWTLHFAPYVSWLVFALVAVLGLALTGMLLWVRARGSIFRVLSLAALLAALANPILRQDEREYLPDIAAVIVDESDSQSLSQRKAQTDDALRSIQQSIGTLKNTELRIGRVTTGDSPETDGTRGFTALQSIVAEIPPEQFAGAIFITDGQIHDVPQPADIAKLKGPLHAVLTGSRTEFDRRIVIDQAPRFAITNKPQPLKFHVEDDGSSQPVTVTAMLPDGSTQEIPVTPGEAQSLEVLIDRAGANIVELSVPERPGEISMRNNRAMALIDGVRDRLRVLLVSGEPHPGERTWRNLLKADAAVDLVHFTILRPPEKQDGTPTKELSLIAFPTRELFLDKIDEFDLVIFDRYKRQAIVPEAYLANIADYVRRGGAVLISSGPDFATGDGLYESSMADVIAAAPTGRVTEQPFRPAVTEQGFRHPVTRRLPGGGKTPNWGKWFRAVETSTSQDAMTLMAGPEQMPLLVLSHQGEGRMAQILSDHGWLWARGYDGGGPQIELLRRVAHWLMKEPELDEEALTAHQSGKSIAIERRTMADTARPVTVTTPTGKQQQVELKQVEPGVFRAQLPFAETGVHRFSDGVLQTAAAIGQADSREMSNLKATEDVLKPVLAATGSAAAWVEDGVPRILKVAPDRPASGPGWLGLRENGVFRVTAIRELPLFSTLLALAGLLLLVPYMWYREGR